MPEMQQRVSIAAAPLNPSPTPDPARTTEDDDAIEIDPHQPNNIPPWVHVATGSGSDEKLQLLPEPPSRTVPNSRHYKPPANYRPGRKWDHIRSPSPPLLSQPIADHQLRWRPFMYSGPNPREQEADAWIVNEKWMDENMPALANLGWREEDDLPVDGAGAQGLLLGNGFRGLMYQGKWLISPERQERTVRLFWRLLLKNPFIPLAFRIATLTFSAAGLGVAATIYERVHTVNTDTDATNNCAPRASTYMAIAVGAVAIPYLGYVTWDEYMSRPLGLRSVAAKTLLLLCDLYFVVFAASNLSLAFDALYDHRWACYDEHFATVVFTGGNATDYNYNVGSTCPDNPNICTKQKTLSGILLISLVAWLLTFSISVMRVVEKLRPD